MNERRAASAVAYMLAWHLLVWISCRTVTAEFYRYSNCGVHSKGNRNPTCQSGIAPA